jgi:glycosyltransferase involved in cell wall biosynthesis
MNNQSTPIISIAMATYNGAKYLEEQIDSILRQTLPASEIVVCDDCSTDATWEMLQRYANMDTRFKIYRNGKNLGFLKNFEKAISMCSGDYIALSDQDDIWTDNHLESLYSNIGNKSMSCGNGLIVDKNNQSLKLTIKSQLVLDRIPRDDFSKAKTILFFRNPYLGATVLFHRSLVNSALPIPDGCEYHDSWIALAACLDKGINYVDEIILNYRRTGENVTTVYDTKVLRFHSLRSCYFPIDRMHMIKRLLERKESLTKSRRRKLREYQFIMKAVLKLQEKHKIVRRIGKLPYLAFLLINCKSIYSCRFFKDVFYS